MGLEDPEDRADPAGLAPAWVSGPVEVHRVFPEHPVAMPMRAVANPQTGRPWSLPAALRWWLRSRRHEEIERALHGWLVEWRVSWRLVARGDHGGAL